MSYLNYFQNIYNQLKETKKIIELNKNNHNTDENTRFIYVNDSTNGAHFVNIWKCFAKTTGFNSFQVQNLNSYVDKGYIHILVERKAKQQKENTTLEEEEPEISIEQKLKDFEVFIDDLLCGKSENELVFSNPAYYTQKAALSELLNRNNLKLLAKYFYHDEILFLDDNKTENTYIIQTYDFGRGYLKKDFMFFQLAKYITLSFKLLKDYYDKYNSQFTSRKTNLRIVFYSITITELIKEYSINTQIHFYRPKHTHIYNDEQHKSELMKQHKIKLLIPYKDSLIL